MKNVIDINYLRKHNLIIFEGISGSIAYGTSTPESDKDIRGVFILPLNYVLKYGFIDQVSDEKNDIVFYEIGRFIELLINNNPNILELLNLPEDCVIYRHPMFKLIEENKDFFLTKKVRWTFAGYAIEQIKKARGYNKKMNWEEKQMTRKTVLDFCYVLVDGGSVAFKEWVKDIISIDGTMSSNWNQHDFSLVNIDHSKDLYAMYKFTNGIVFHEDKSHDVQLTSIPNGMKPIAYLSFNKDGYSSHCKKYSEYQTWLKERNPNRFKMNKEHGKNYDSKNMCHCMRLLDMVIEMLDTNKINVRRPKEHIEYLMKIRKGEMEYEDLLKMAEYKISLLDEKFSKSTLPEKVDKEFAYYLLGKMRSAFYL